MASFRRCQPAWNFLTCKQSENRFGKAAWRSQARFALNVRNFRRKEEQSEGPSRWASWMSAFTSCTSYSRSFRSELYIGYITYHPIARARPHPFQCLKAANQKHPTIIYGSHPGC
jgi:hypothetical protein